MSRSKSRISGAIARRRKNPTRSNLRVVRTEILSATKQACRLGGFYLCAKVVIEDALRSYSE